MKITEIRKLKHLYRLTTDAEFATAEGELTDRLYITEDTVVRYMLTRDLELTAAELADIAAYSAFSRGNNLALYYLSFKARTKREIITYLAAHELSGRDIARIIDKLTADGLVDDSAYAENYILSQIRSGKYGPYVLRQKLLQKGLDEDLISRQLTEHYDEAQQETIAKKIAAKLAKTRTGRLPLKMLRQKIQQSLVSKGFSYDLAAATIESLQLTADEDSERELLSSEAERAYQRFSRRYDGYDLKRRLSQALMRKGFDYSDIAEALDAYDF